MAFAVGHGRECDKGDRGEMKANDPSRILSVRIESMTFGSEDRWTAPFIV